MITRVPPKKPKIEPALSAPSEEHPCLASLVRSCELVLLGPVKALCLFKNNLV